MINKCCLRIDDIGASSKEFEVYSNSFIGNISFLKYLKIFKAWGKYEELNSDDWKRIIDLLIKYNSKLTVGVTAAWVERDSSLVPYPEKFQSEALILKQAFEDNIIEIANHGLSHCIIGEHLPRTFTSNRIYHREFWNWLPTKLHYDHMRESQKIFHEWLGVKITSFIPPGNVYSYDTIAAANEYNIKRINAKNKLFTDLPINIIGLENIIAFHDREIKVYGLIWLEELLKSHVEKEHYFLREIS